MMKAATLPPTTGPASEVLRSYSTLKPNVIKAAEKMPEADFQFAPTPEIRTFARVVNHVTKRSSGRAPILNGTKEFAKPPVGHGGQGDHRCGAEGVVCECDKAYGALTDTNVTEMMPAGANKRSRIGMAWGNVSHDNEQYAELVDVSAVEEHCCLHEREVGQPKQAGEEAGRFDEAPRSYLRDCWWRARHPAPVDAVIVSWLLNIRWRFTPL